MSPAGKFPSQIIVFNYKTVIQHKYQGLGSKGRAPEHWEYKFWNFFGNFVWKFSLFQKKMCLLHFLGHPPLPLAGADQFICLSTMKCVLIVHQFCSLHAYKHTSGTNTCTQHKPPNIRTSDMNTKTQNAPTNTQPHTQHLHTHTQHPVHTLFTHTQTRFDYIQI